MLLLTLGSGLYFRRIDGPTVLFIIWVFMSVFYKALRSVNERLKVWGIANTLIFLLLVWYGRSVPQVGMQ